MKTYRIRLDKDVYLNLWIASIYIKKRQCIIGNYKSRRAARKAAKDFIKQIKEAEGQGKNAIKMDARLTFTICPVCEMAVWSYRRPDEGSVCASCKWSSGS